MLDRAQLLKQINLMSESLFLANPFFEELGSLIGNFLDKEPSFISLLAGKKDLFLPTFEGIATQSFSISQLKQYSILSVDGSQIYPDRHFGISCYLINIGSVRLYYNYLGKPVLFETTPYLYCAENFLFNPSISMINSRRQELEFKIGFEQALIMKEERKDVPFFLLFDGSLIFWHLDDKELKKQFFSIYMDWLEQLACHNILTASYISLPKSSELISLLYAFAQIEGYSINGALKIALESFIDTNFISSFLKPYERTNIFVSTVPQVKGYISHLTPCFFYIHVGTEIGRVEVPAWLANDKAYIDAVASCILDQAIKGRGYPVALAEAHEQAVVKGPDREFFYQLLTKISMDQGKKIKISAKSLMKKGMIF